MDDLGTTDYAMVVEDVGEEVSSEEDMDLVEPRVDRGDANLPRNPSSLEYVSHPAKAETRGTTAHSFIAIGNKQHQPYIQS